MVDFLVVSRVFVSLGFRSLVVSGFSRESDDREGGEMKGKKKDG
jgi:hypothetical protein